MLETGVDRLIDRIRDSTREDLARSGAVGLVNLIPYAGSAIASVMGDFASFRRIEKICEVLSELNTQLQRRHLRPDAFLTRDQVVELVYETLQAAAVASTQSKIDALKAGLVQAFVSPGQFDRKQLFLQVLRETTDSELTILRVLYEAPDPFIVGRGGPDRTPENGSPKHPYLAKGFWHTEGRTESRGSQTLLKYLTARSAQDSALVEGALRRLDGRGLSSATANLERSDMKIVSWLPMPEEHIKSLGAASISYETGKEVRSPLEASRTKLGDEFLKQWHPQPPA